MLASVPVACPLKPSRGWMRAHPDHAERLASLGIDSPLSLLDLPGEVVSGHPDRHVARVELPGWPCGLYLKRQHRVGWRERFTQRRAGFGWASRSEREADILIELEAAGFPTPNWVAFGEDGTGRAFLLLEELRDLRELRQHLGDIRLSQHERRELAERFGQAVAELHGAGFDTPDLTAKHVFVDPDSRAITLIDWQNASRTRPRDRSQRLGALHASLPESLASTRERLRFLVAYRRTSGIPLRIDSIALEARKLAKRRSIRDQRQPVVTGKEQRLVWLASEAVCAVPDVAAIWPTPAVCEPFYGAATPEVTRRYTLADGREAVLMRGRCWAPAGRLRAWFRGRSWRSPGVTLGRVLFHLERYGIPSPRLFAFGQRFTSATHSEWFVLHEAHPILNLNGVALCEYQELLEQLHNAGCRPDFRTGVPFGRIGDRLGVIDPRAIRIVRKLSSRKRRADAVALAQLLRMPSRSHSPE